MEPISTLMFFTFFIAISLGIYILLIDIRNKIHLLFFLLATNLALWNLFAGIAFSAPTEKKLWLFFRIGATFEILYVSLTLHFILYLTRPNISPGIVMTIYTLSLPVQYRNWSSFFAFNKVKRINHVWVLKPAFHSFWMHYWNLFFEIITVASLILLFRWLQQAKIKREKEQAKILFYSFMSYVILCIVGDYFFSPHLKLPPLSPSYSLIFLGGIFYSIIKYRFMTITQITISKEILENIDALIILLDTNMEIIRANNKAEEYFGVPSSNLVGKKFLNLLFNNQQTKTPQMHLARLCLRKIIEEQKETIECFIKIKGKPVSNTPKHKLPENDFTIVRIHFSPVKDKNGDNLGILLVGNEVPQAKQFIKNFHLSEREWETIQYLNMGITNRKIAEYMKIGERTVKSHIAHIYNKLGIKSKLELINKLRDFNTSKGFPSIGFPRLF